MATDLVARLDRRGFLAVAAAALAASGGPAFGQTLIQDTPASDVGYSRRPETVISNGDGGTSAPRLMAGHPEVPTAVSTAASSDWKKFLLAGERSILMRRDGAPQRVRYCTRDGLLDRDGYAAACNLLRDVRAGKLFTMDPRLLDVLCGLQRWAEFNGRSALIQITSGFRSATTNEATEGAAKNSMHLYGKAADIVFDGISSGLLGAMVREFNSQGGTGIYLSRGFVHVDTGTARTWVSVGRRR